MRDGRAFRIALGSAILAFMAVVALAAPLLATEESLFVGHNPDTIDLANRLTPPSSEHPMGTDALGRDLSSRLIHGARRSLFTGLLATAVAVMLGFGLGALSGMSRALPRAGLDRLGDVFYAFPALVAAVVLIGGEGARLPRTLAIGLVIGAFSWPPLYRLARAEVSRWATSDVADSARLAGASPWTVALRHVLPNAWTPALGPAAFVAGGAVLAEAGLGFLGLGFRAPTSSWGSLLAEGRSAIYGVSDAWWLVLFPGLAVFATVVAFQLLADGLRPPDGSGGVEERGARPAGR